MKFKLVCCSLLAALCFMDVEAANLRIQNNTHKSIKYKIRYKDKPAEGWAALSYVVWKTGKGILGPRQSLSVDKYKLGRLQIKDLDKQIYIRKDLNDYNKGFGRYKLDLIHNNIIVKNQQNYPSILYGFRVSN